jgi:hypothetical protein
MEKALEKIIVAFEAATETSLLSASAA